MAEKEVNTIAHLLEVEQKATELTSQAQIDADKKIAAAKSQADPEFKLQYEKIVSECEKSYGEKCSALDSKRDSELSSYKNTISASSIDKAAFNSFLDSLLFA